MRLRIRNPTPLQWGLIVTAGALALTGFAGAAYARRRRPGDKPVGPVLPPGKRDPDIDPDIPGSGKIIPGPHNQGPPPLPNGWGGGQYGPGPIPAEFDWNGNLVYISPDCRTIAEGRLFLPMPGTQIVENWWLPANGGPDGQPTLADALRFVGHLGQTGTAWGFIARTLAEYARAGNELQWGIYEAKVVTLDELLQMQAVEPKCDWPKEVWPDDNPTKAMRDWWENFSIRVEGGVDAFPDWYFWNEFWEVS